jgi:hypothetical protein
MRDAFREGIMVLKFALTPTRSAARIDLPLSGGEKWNSDV